MNIPRDQLHPSSLHMVMPVAEAHAMVRYDLQTPSSSERELAGRRENFTIVELARWIINKGVRMQILAGTLWYHEDGSLALFADVPDMSVYPSMTSAQIGFKDMKPFEQGYYVPTTVSPAERTVILAGV